jgi:hypothetical protein
MKVRKLLTDAQAHLEAATVPLADAYITTELGHDDLIEIRTMYAQLTVMADTLRAIVRRAPQ